MLEAKLKKYYETYVIEPILKIPFLRRIPANAFTLASLITGVLVLPLLAFDSPHAALVLLIFSGFFDTLDGAQARALKTTSSRGTFFDIFSDRLVEFCIILGFLFVAPHERAIPCFFMLGSVFLCVTAFLTIGIVTENDTQKGFFYHPGLIERTEAFILFALMMLFPAYFKVLSYLFSFLVFLTAALHVYLFSKRP